MAGSQERFGSQDSTGRKLEIIREYLNMYQKSVGSQHWSTTHYVDAFAGTGRIPINDAVVATDQNEELFSRETYNEEFAQIIIEGSTKIALDIENPFDNYNFIELKKKKISELKEHFKDHKHSSRITFMHGDANDKVQEFCSNMTSKDRAVIFLDPFGSQVEWKTVVSIAETQKVDLWYLFPSGAGVFRQISNDKGVHYTHEPSITRIFGTDAWKSRFMKPAEQADLFGPRTYIEKTVTPESAAEYMLERMSEIFAGVGDFKIPLGKHGYPSFHLLFAWGNPSNAASALARKLSKAAVKASRNYGRD